MSIRHKTRITITLRGIGAGIMFDRYGGTNDTVLPPEDKMYFKRNTRELIMPTANIASFLFAENTKSAPKVLEDSRKYKAIAHAFASYVMIDADQISITRDGKPIVFTEFGKNGFELHHSIARLPKGIPNPKERPLLLPPWEITFDLVVLPNTDLTLDIIQRMFREGGLCVGLGTYRPQYGKFVLEQFTPTIIEKIQPQVETKPEEI